MSAAVSAIARPIPSTRPTTSPGAAAGRSRWNSVVVRDIPRAAADMRYSAGTARNPSSVDRMRIGSTMQASVRPPDRIEKPSPRILQKKALPNKPKMMDGTPDRMSRLRRVRRPKTLSSVVNSASRTAAPTPIGTDTARHTLRIKPVETSMGPIPPARPAFLGAELRNSQESLSSPCHTMSPSNQRKITVTTPAQVQTSTVTIRSRRWIDSGIDPALADDFCSCHQRHDQQHEDQTADEQRRAVIAQRIGHLQGDIRGERPNRIEQARGCLHHVATDHENGHGFADGPASFEDHASEESRFRGGKDHSAHRSPAR